MRTLQRRVMLSGSAAFATLVVAGPMVAALFAPTPALGQAPAGAFPNKPIRLIVPAPPGSAPDFLSRTMSAKLTELWGQPIIVDNVVGASGHIGTERVAKAAPDGYTLLFNTIGPIAVNVNLFDKLPFDPVKDFVPITLVAKTPNLLCLNNALPAKSVAELIALAKQQPGKLRFGSAGSGTTPHLSGELFNVMAGVQLVHIPYKSSAQMTTDTIGGQVELIFHNAPVVLPHHKAGSLRCLGITSGRRHESAPELPTLSEAGLPGYEVTAWFGILAPTGTPAAVISKVHGDVVKVLAMPDVKERFVTQIAEPVASTPEEFGAFIRTEITKWAAVVKQSKARVD
jgi:tripartite-type tricarboxylate transporter receptor subunit TctC